MTAQDKIDQKRREIASLEREQLSCSHTWEAIKYEPIVSGGREVEDYHFPRPGRMVYIPEQRRPRWTRRCSKCGKIEETERTKPVHRPGSMPGTTATEQIPDFGDRM